MAEVMNPNGRPQRKTLAHQLDRLDGIICTLAENLNGAMADVVREAVGMAVQQAVETVLREVLSRPELLRQLTAQSQPEPVKQTEPKPAPPSALKKLLAWVGTKVSSTWQWLSVRGGSVGTRIGERSRIVCGTVRQGVCSAWERRSTVCLSLLIGLAVGGVGYLAGPLLCSLVLGMSSSVASFVAFLATPYIRLWRGMRGMPV